MFYRLRLLFIVRSPRPIGSIVRRREAKLLVDGGEAFGRIFDLIASARHTIIIHMFIWLDDATGREVARSVLEAADRGVHVQVFKDAVGDFFEMDKDFLATRSSPDDVWRRFWSHPNIAIRNEPESNHAKVFIIDDEILLLGGMNISNQYRYQWHDFFVELRGPRFVTEYLSGQHEVLPHGGHVRLIINGPHRKDVRQELSALLKSAQRDVTLEQAYLSDATVLSLLAALSHRGVRIRIIVSANMSIHHSANMVAIADLMSRGNRSNIQVYLYPRVIHGKLILVDRCVAFIGSANLMSSSLDSMGEINVLLTGKNTQILRKIRRIIRTDVHMSKRMRNIRKTRWLTRLLAFLGF